MHLMALKLLEGQQRKEQQKEPGNEKWRDNGQLGLTQQISMLVSIVGDYILVGQ